MLNSPCEANHKKGMRQPAMGDGSRADEIFRGANNLNRGKGISIKKLRNGLDIGDFPL